MLAERMFSTWPFALNLIGPPSDTRPVAGMSVLRIASASVFGSTEPARLYASAAIISASNVNPTFAADNRCFPKPVKPFAQTEPDGYREQWITYGTGWYSAKELTVLPKRSVTIKDAAAYGIILTQGYGRFGSLAVSTPSMIRFGQMTEDELFVTEGAALEGVKIENLSATDPLVILKHFGPGNPDAEGLRKKR